MANPAFMQLGDVEVRLLGRNPKLIERQKREAIGGRDIDVEPVREIARS